LHLADRHQRVVDYLGNGDGLDLAGRDVAIHIPPLNLD
jgi:hypothetical protein